MACAAEERPALLEPFTLPEAGPCELGEPSLDYFSSEFLDTAEYWQCAPPAPGGGTTTFVEAQGTRATVTGGIARFDLDWEGEGDLTGREMVLWVGALARGFYTFAPLTNDDPQHWELQINPEVPSGDYDLYMAIGDGRDEKFRPIIGTALSTSLHVIQVGTGDIQINLNWDTQADLDLWVTEPSGEQVFYGATQSSTGGRLDLDSYAACQVENDAGRGNENVYWPTGRAPSGTYTVEVDMFSPCDTLAADVDTNYHVTVVQGGGVSSFEGTFRPSDDDARKTVTTFNYE